MSETKEAYYPPEAIKAAYDHGRRDGETECAARLQRELDAAKKEAERERATKEEFMSLAAHTVEVAQPIADNYDRLRAALEGIAEGRFACADGNCMAILTAQEALETPTPTSPWRPIETAPKDGTLILLYPTNSDELTSDGLVGIGYRHLNGTRWAAGHARFEESEVSHWMPIPSPPDADRQGKEAM